MTIDHALHYYTWLSLMLVVITSEYAASSPDVEIVTVLSEPFAMLVDCEETDDPNLCEREKRLQGFCVDLLEHISTRSPLIKYRLSVVNDNKYGEKLANGSWNGLIGALVQSNVSAAIAPLIKTAEREEVVDFTEPFLSTGVTIMMRKSTESKAFLLLKPFTATAWICLIVVNIAFILAIIVVRQLLRSSTFEEINKKKHNCAGDDIDMGYSQFTFVSQEHYSYKRSISLRIAIVAWCIFMLFVTASYTANLTAILVNERLRQPITSAEDLLRQSRIKYGILKGGATQRFFENTTSVVYRRMWNIMKQQSPSVLVSSYDEGIEKVRKSGGKYAFLLEETANDYANSRFPCNTRKVGTRLNEAGYHIAISRRSSWLRKIFNKAILEMKSNGEMKEIEKKWFHSTNECKDKNDSTDDGDETQIGIGQLTIVLLVLFIGCILMVMTVICESNILYRSRRMSTAEQMLLNRLDTTQCSSPHT